ncbi:unnamed protein product [Cuscuta europaea]|uniref:Retrotransposon Copia-like N-terminal domain-containing protein n=1 Tax=Cuscuta europaea TaxID=41803 RepID=A0A9P0Z4A0_CUSEU|nr:unnamed protein product [Cuscuta europaea]
MTNDGANSSHGEQRTHGDPIRWKINDPESPYFLSKSDYPDMNICGLTLKGEGKYREWSVAMKNALRAKWKTVFIDGTIKRPTTNKDDLEDWLQVNSMMVGWIMTAADPSLRSNLTYMESAYDLWTDLAERFAVGDSMRIYELKDAIRGCKQNRESVTSYFGRLKTLWDDYEGYRNIPKCTCGGCTCGLNKAYQKQLESEKTQKFLL